MVARTGAAFYVIGLGGGGEVAIDYVDPFTKLRRAGSFDSRFDAESLRALARSGGGLYLGAPSAAAFTAAFAQVSENEASVTRAVRRTSRVSAASPFLLAGLALAAAAHFFRRWLLGAFL